MIACEKDIRLLDELYAGRAPYHGELHDHGATGGTSDGKRPLSHWKGALEALKITTNRPNINRVYIVGGGSVISYLNQFIANVTGTEIITGPREASSMDGSMFLSRPRLS